MHELAPRTGHPGVRSEFVDGNLGRGRRYLAVHGANDLDARRS